MGLKIRLAAAWLAALILASAGMTVLAQEQENETPSLQGSGSPNLDVLFVTDCSGSMNESDPQDLACEAMKLFMDICEYDSTRVCVVEYTERIVDVLPLQEIAEGRDALKAQIDGLYTKDFYGWTDLSLGLMEAKNQLVSDDKALSGNRRPLIILLSDGDTVLGQNGIGPGGRTLEDANQDLEMVLSELKALGVPVFPIGLLSEKAQRVMGETAVTRISDTIAHISDVTGGRAYMTDKAEDIPEILREIYALNIDTGEVEVGRFTGDGQSHNVTITIPNSSIYEGNIVILSGQDVTDVHLYDPNGTEMEMPGENIVYNTSKIYTHIKLFRPMQGDWTLAVTGAVGDQVTVTFLSYYGMGMDVTLNGEEFEIGAPINAEVTFYNSSGVIDDPRLLSGAAGYLSLRDKAGVEVARTELSLNGAKMTGSMDAQKNGSYELVAQVCGEDGSFEKESAPKRITIFPPELIAKKDASVLMLFPLLKTTAAVPLEKVVTASDSAIFTIRSQNSGWSDLCEIGFNSGENRLELSALKSGSAEASFQISDQWGGRTEFAVHIRILPVWLAAVILALLIAAIVLVAKILINKSKPRLSGELSMSVRLEDGRNLVETTVDLSMLARKSGAQPFNHVIGCIPDPVLQQQYRNALSPLQPFLSKVTLSRQRNQSGQLVISLPRPPAGWRIQVNDDEWTADQADYLSSLREYVIAFDTMNRGIAQCELYLSFKEAGGGDGGGFNNFGGGFDGETGSFGGEEGIDFNEF